MLIRSARRLLIALVLGVVAFGGWVGGVSPAIDPAEPAAVVQPSPSGSPNPQGTPAAVGGATPQPSTAGLPDANGGAGASPGPAGSGSPPPVGAPTASTAPIALLQAHLDRWRVKTGSPGLSVSIVFADGSSWNGVSGLADIASKRPVTPGTAFAVASVSKTFTSALVLDLVAEGKLALDRSARSYLPSLPIDKRITIRQLLDHTSGLRDFFLDRRIDPVLQADPSRRWTPAMDFKYVGKLLGKPGTVWHYSNTNYLVLGLVAEAVGGAPVADQLRSRFLDPLGMRGTWYQAVERPRAPLATAYRLLGTKPTAKPIPLSDEAGIAPFTSVITAAGAAGSIASTAPDLARWVGALYGGDALSPDARALLIGHVADTAALHPPFAYGFGVQSFTIAGHPTLGHSGRLLGARVAVRWLPRERVAIAVVTNQSRKDPAGLVADLIKVLYPPAVETIPVTPGVPSPAPTPAATPAY
jgi:CubicO group peptidase (beta-lactamase class C family)